MCAHNFTNVCFPRHHDSSPHHHHAGCGADAAGCWGCPRSDKLDQASRARLARWVSPAACPCWDYHPSLACIRPASPPAESPEALLASFLIIRRTCAQVPRTLRRGLVSVALLAAPAARCHACLAITPLSLWPPSAVAPAAYKAATSPKAFISATALDTVGGCARPVTLTRT